MDKHKDAKRLEVLWQAAVKCKQKVAASSISYKSIVAKAEVNTSKN